MTSPAFTNQVWIVLLIFLLLQPAKAARREVLREIIKVERLKEVGRKAGSLET